MPLPRFERLAPKKRKELLETAAAEFGNKGYEAASLNAILAEAGLGKSSYYYYFSDKEDLFVTVVEHAWGRIQASGRPIAVGSLTKKTFWPAVERSAIAYTAALAQHPSYIAMARDVHAFWRNPPARLRALVERTTGMLRGFIAVGQRIGCVRKDLPAERLMGLLQAADTALDAHLLSQLPAVTKEEIVAHARLAMDTFRRLAEPHPSSTRRKS